MWRVQFRLEDKNPAGKVVFTQYLIEGGFENKGQAEAWLATGAKQRYGAAFWHRCAKVTVLEGDNKITITQVEAPEFYAGGSNVGRF
jgi:hypothetical protein